MLDDHDVPGGVNVLYFTADIWKGPCERGDRVSNGLSAKLRARSHIPHVTFLREKGYKLLGVQSWPFPGKIEFFDNFLIVRGVRGHFGGLRQSLRVLYSRMFFSLPFRTVMAKTNRPRTSYSSLRLSPWRSR